MTSSGNNPWTSLFRLGVAWWGALCTWTWTFLSIWVNIILLAFTRDFIRPDILIIALSVSISHIHFKPLLNPLGTNCKSGWTFLSIWETIIQLAFTRDFIRTDILIIPLFVLISHRQFQPLFHPLGTNFPVPSYFFTYFFTCLGNKMSSFPPTYFQPLFHPPDTLIIFQLASSLP